MPLFTKVGFLFAQVYALFLIANIFYSVNNLGYSKSQKFSVSYHAYEQNNYDVTQSTNPTQKRWQFDSFVLPNSKLADSNAIGCKDGEDLNCGISILQSTDFCNLAGVQTYTEFKNRLQEDETDIFQSNNVNFSSTDVVDLFVATEYTPDDTKKSLTQDNDKFSTTFKYKDGKIYYKYDMAEANCQASRIGRSSFYTNKANNSTLFGLHNANILMFWISYILLHSLLSSLGHWQSDAKDVSENVFENYLNCITNFFILIFSMNWYFLPEKDEKYVETTRKQIKKCIENGTLLAGLKYLSILIFVVFYFTDHANYGSFTLNNMKYEKQSSLGSFFYAIFTIVVYFYIDYIYKHGQYLGTEIDDATDENVPYAIPTPKTPNEVPPPLGPTAGKLTFAGFKTNAFQKGDQVCFYNRNDNSGGINEMKFGPDDLKTAASMTMVSKNSLISFLITPMLALACVTGNEHYVLDAKLFHIYVLTVLYCILILASDRACSVFVMLSNLGTEMHKSMQFINLFVVVITFVLNLFISIQIGLEFRHSVWPVYDREIWDVWTVFVIFLVMYSISHTIYQVIVKTKGRVKNSLDTWEESPFLTFLHPACIFALFFIFYVVQHHINFSTKNNFIVDIDNYLQTPKILNLVSGFSEI